LEWSECTASTLLRVYDYQFAMFGWLVGLQVENTGQLAGMKENVICSHSL